MYLCKSREIIPFNLTTHSTFNSSLFTAEMFEKKTFAITHQNLHMKDRGGRGVVIFSFLIVHETRVHVALNLIHLCSWLTPLNSPSPLRIHRLRYVT
jgi:hypothetical protein